MGSITQYICQPYTTDTKGALRPGSAVIFANEGMACIRASRFLESRRAVGVDIVKQTVDTELGDYGEPEFLRRFGRVPLLEL